MNSDIILRHDTDRGRIYLECGDDLILDQYLSWTMAGDDIQVIPYDKNDKNAVITADGVVVDGVQYTCDTAWIRRNISYFEHYCDRSVDIYLEDNMIVFDIAGYQYQNIGRFRVPYAELNKVIIHGPSRYYAGDLICTILGYNQCIVYEDCLYGICRVTMDAEESSC